MWGIIILGKLDYIDRYTWMGSGNEDLEKCE